MNYKTERKLFNIYTGIELLNFLRYSYGSETYKRKTQERKIRELAKNAYEIPFYKRRFDEGGVDPDSIRTPKDLSRLPLLSKEEFRAWMDEEKAKDENKGCMGLRTSGSSGMPLEVMVTPKEYARDIANVLRSMIVAGYNPFFGKTMTEKDSSSEDVGYKTFIQKLGILRREIFNEDLEAGKIIELVNSFEPNIVRMYKSEMLRVAIYAENNQISFHNPDYMLAIGENIDDVSAQVIERNWGGKLINLYGCVENGSIAVKKPGSNKYLLFDDACIVNVYNDNNELAEEGRVILTTLYKYRFPLINYDLRDIVTINKEDRRYLDVIKGRANDRIKYKDGSFSDWIQLWHIFSQRQCIYQVRLIQRNFDVLECEMVIKEGTNVDALKKELHDEMQEKVLKGRIALVINTVDNIPAESSGKVRMVVSYV